MGDNAFIKEVLQLFLDNTLPEIIILKEKIAKQDWTGSSSTAHKMKSSISMLGNETASVIVMTIEQNAKNKTNTSELSVEAEKLEQLLNDMATAIKEKIATL